ncbi:MAG TPA: trypsin-like peptidase domain-containing protein, partial [Planctomycetota bacterium]|nr:trypsin-like peptidase domain-containing protein [Planctomycetota bacterium]
MLRRARAVVAAVLLAAALAPAAGCVRPATQEEIDAALVADGIHVPTLEEKAASFKPYEAERIGGEAIARFLASRTARLLDGVEFEKPAIEGGRIQFSSKSVGTAVAIAFDGYFLTAAHCVARGSVVLAVPRPDGEQVRGGELVCSWQVGRIVWAGDASKGCDLALVKVDGPLLATFRWAEPGEVVAGTRLVTVGYGRQSGVEARTVFAGGQALGPIPAPRSADPR